MSWLRMLRRKLSSHESLHRRASHSAGSRVCCTCLQNRAHTLLHPSCLCYHCKGCITLLPLEQSQ